MPIFDLSLEELRHYRPLRQEPADFDAFWQKTLAEARQWELNPRFEPADFGLRTVEAFDTVFCGYGGQPIKGWLLLPKNQPRPLPAVIEFIGYGGGRGFPTDWLQWSSAGYAHLVMDTRGQGSNWLHGDTPDPEVDGAGPHFPGFMTRGIRSPEAYYYRRLFTDAVRAVETAQAHSEIDPHRLAVVGNSQGGGVALAVSGLCPEIPALIADVPFLCHYRRAMEISDAYPYGEIVAYCHAHRDQVESVFQTLAYFDGVNLGTRARARALFSAGLRDETCPPSTVFAAYNHYGGPKEIRVYPYNQHEGGGSHQTIEKMRFLRALWGE